MSRPKVVGSKVKRIRRAIGGVRELLKAYGCNNTETVKQAVARLIEEHAAAAKEVKASEARAVAAEARASLAEQTRNGAQELANKYLEELRSVKQQNASLRAELEAYRRGLITGVFVELCNPEESNADVD